MGEIVLFTGILIGSFTVTSYRSVPEQTDDSPFITSTGERVCADGVAVSQDWLRRFGGSLDYGDWVYIENVGLKRINDNMNKRHKKRFDVWVSSYKQEQAFDKKYGKRKLKVWKVSGGMYGRPIP